MLLKIIYFGQFLWSPFFFFLKAVFMKTILKWEIISFGGWKNKVTFSRNLFTWNFNEGMGECVRVT